MDREKLDSLAEQVGTPFWVYDAQELRRRIADVKALTDGEGLQARFAMKSCPLHSVMREMRDAGLWIDAVSANECLRARAAGFDGGQEPPVILYTTDVLRDNWRDAVFDENVLPNIGSPGMLRDLVDAGYQGAVAIRVNVGFGHGHVNSCDTGGPSSKHGIWWEDAAVFGEQAKAAGCPVVMMHTHVGSGPQQLEFRENMQRIVDVFSEWAGAFPDLTGVSVGGGLPWNYREEEALEIDALRKILVDGRARLSEIVGRDIRLEIEPGRYLVASSGTLVSRVTDFKQTQENEKGQGHQFAMVDAGFIDLIRPAMYGSYHRISLPGCEGEEVSYSVAGPICESGDVFTRGADEMLEPRNLPRPEPGDLLCIHDGGAYGYVMSSNYNSIGRAPQVWKDGEDYRLVSRRETLDDVLRSEVDEALS
ncbi:MAG: diaminopimelate decarboxylase [Verrucomicrobiota bacterium]